MDSSNALSRVRVLDKSKFPPLIKNQFVSKTVPVNGKQIVSLSNSKVNTGTSNFYDLFKKPTIVAPQVAKKVVIPESIPVITATVTTPKTSAVATTKKQVVKVVPTTPTKKVTPASAEKPPVVTVEDWKTPITTASENKNPIGFTDDSTSATNTNTKAEVYSTAAKNAALESMINSVKLNGDPRQLEKDKASHAKIINATNAFYFNGTNRQEAGKSQFDWEVERLNAIRAATAGTK